MKVSDCCCRGPANDVGICPACKEHCEWIEEDDEDAAQQLRAYAMYSARKLAGHLADMKAQKASLPVVLNSKRYMVTVEAVGDANA